ncbi:spermidine synthase [Niveibacterium sp. COAC-50]|uniref:spermine/spermidine synthase domain-containing protein n=1 Tax=Niveibacterium sp. COAC-50 TaxID=2729384 RepID=UPI0015522A2D|nr:spermidine synthase [Niveibacterium sp. COAC-50]
MIPTVRRHVLVVLFLFSGVCGLIYESIWPHYLKLFLGHAAYAQTLVLVVFIGGMALGAWAAGYFTERLSNPLRWYALVELAIGVLALVFHGVFVVATDWAYAVLIPATCSADSLCYAQWGLSAALILPQSILLGATFPLMTAGYLRLADGAVGRPLALLYAQNTLGGVVGVLLSAFLLVPAVGLPGSLLTAGIGNIVLAIAVYGISKSVPVADNFVQSSEERGSTPIRLLLLVAALTGLSSFFYEVVWIRMLNLVLGSSTHAFELMLASFLFGLAVGGYLIRNRIESIRRPLLVLAYVQVVMGVCAALTLPVYDRLFGAMSFLMAALTPTLQGYALFNFGGALLAMAVMLPATIAAGMTLPLITHVLIRSGAGESYIGRVYAANTIGAIIGVGLVVHIGLPLIGVKGSLVFAAALDVVLGLVLFFACGTADRKRRISTILVGATGMLAVALVGGFSEIDQKKAASGVFRYGRATLGSTADVTFFRDGKSATIAVTKYPDGLVTIMTNGKPDAAAFPGKKQPRQAQDYPTMVMMGLAGPLHFPSAKTAAVIGFGSGISSSVLLASPVLQRVDTVEIEPAIVEGARKFSPLNDRVYSDSRSHIVIDDAKAYFARSAGKYDLIVSEPSNPWVSGVAGLFTDEFYRRVRTHLNEGGLFVQWLHTYELELPLVASVMKALGSQFSDYVIYQSSQGDLIVVATSSGRVSGPNASVLSRREVLEVAETAGVQFVDEWAVRKVGAKLELQPFFDQFNVAKNSDYFPVLDQGAARSRFMKQDADGILSLRFSKVPVAEVLGVRATSLLKAESLDDLPRPPLSERFHASRALLTSAMNGRAVQDPALSGFDLFPALRGFALTASSCPLGANDIVALESSMVDLASAAFFSLNTSERPVFWRTLAKNACITQDPALQQWWALLDAALRDQSERVLALSDALSAADGAGRLASPERIELLILVRAKALRELGRKTQFAEEVTAGFRKLGKMKYNSIPVTALVAYSKSEMDVGNIESISR